MLRRLRSLILVVVAASLGAVLGRVVLQARQQSEAGQPVGDLDLSKVSIRLPDLVPGLIAAFRVKDPPWSWFRIPSWLAAFAVNFGVAAAGSDIGALRARAERMAFEAVGLDARDFGLGEDPDDGGTYASGMTAEPPSTPSAASPPGEGGAPSWGSVPPPPPPSGGSVAG